VTVPALLGSNSVPDAPAVRIARANPFGWPCQELQRMDRLQSRREKCTLAHTLETAGAAGAPWLGGVSRSR